MIGETVKCAVYTRKSTDEGLDMEFNSLDAQREAAEAFIASQRHRGWTCLPERYDDGGYSGGNTNRPALKHLKADIEDGKVDVVVVYKIDRLSRSIYDFAELFQLFEKHHVEFVSVTQDINTATSAGRMMLNILMSFAQYEREIITERIKDKVAAAKKKGMHTGGFPPVGYASNPRTHKLEIVPEQAEVIRRIFREYIEKGSAKDVAISLAADGIRTPVWTSSRGQAHGGKEYSMAQIYAILSNPLYIGKVRHYDKTYPGEQPPIVAQDVWDSVQTTLAANKCSDGRRHVRITPMRGLFKCGYCGGVMKEACTKRDKTKYYRYLICDKDSKRTRSKCPLRRAPADELERVVLEHSLALLSRPELYQGIHEQIMLVHPDGGVTDAMVRNACEDLSQIWEYLYPVEKFKLIRSIVREVKVFKEQMDIEYSLDGIGQLVREQAVGGASTGEAAEGQESGRVAPPKPPKSMKLERRPNGNFLERIPISIKYDGHKTTVTEPEDGDKPLDPETMNPLQKAMVQGIQYSRLMEGGQAATLTELAAQLGGERTFIYHSLELVNLAPDIQKAIIGGRIPDGFTLAKLRKGIPDTWAEQREKFGFAQPAR